MNPETQLVPLFMMVYGPTLVICICVAALAMKHYEANPARAKRRIILALIAAALPMFLLVYLAAINWGA